LALEGAVKAPAGGGRRPPIQSTFAVLISLPGSPKFYSPDLSMTAIAIAIAIAVSITSAQI
jgi:hypothetical protein